jgi:ubiquinone/menaquinone biosynthesis C-methylase UbiE
MTQNDPQSVQQAKQRLSSVFNKNVAIYDRVGPPVFSTYGRKLAETVLDVATGTGAVLFPAAEIAGPAARLVGIDFSEGMINETKRQIERLGLANVETRLMDAEHLDFPDASFDCVFCGFSVFTFPQPERGLGEIVRVLKPGGRFALSNWSPSVYQGLARTFELLKRYLPPEAPVPLAGIGRFADPQRLAAMLAEAGFISVQARPLDADFTFASEAEYWDWVGSTGIRGAIDALLSNAGTAALQSFKADFYALLQGYKKPDGLHGPAGAVFFVARKPAG